MRKMSALKINANAAENYTNQNVLPKIIIKLLIFPELDLIFSIHEFRFRLRYNLMCSYWIVVCIIFE